MSDLSKGSDRLGELEVVIKSSLRKTLDMYHALKEIRDDRLFEQKGYASFAEYCKQEWDIGSSLANKAIVAIDIRDRLKGVIADEIFGKIETEGQIRELTGVPEDKLGDVITAAVEKSKGEGISHIPARVIRDARKDVVEGVARKSEPQSVYDIDSEILEKSSRKCCDLIHSLRKHLGILGMLESFGPSLQKILRKVEV